MQWQLTETQASEFARLPLRCVRQEFPNAPGLVLTGPESLARPSKLHPAFYGCFDWHSSVHGHWMLARLLRRFDLPEKSEIREVLNQSLTLENLAQEADYFARNPTFERTYGWAWLLKLAVELDHDDPDFRRWASALKKLETVVVEGYLRYLPKQNYPIRTGMHSNSAFGLTFALDYARHRGHQELATLVEDRARAWFEADAAYPGHLEPSGSDFFSPCLMEADLIRKIVPGQEFRNWFAKFLPDVHLSQALLTPALVSDRTDPQIAHLDGLNISRAWCLRRIGTALPEGSDRTALLDAAQRHAEAGIAHVASGDYAGEHWLASFAVYLLTE